MKRVFVCAWGALAMTATGWAEESTSIRSDRGSNHAEIIQSGDPSDGPAVKVEEGPGYVVIRQHSRNNRAIIIQQTRPKE